MKKFCTLIALILALVLTMSACGNASEQIPVAAAPTETVTTPAPAQTEEPIIAEVDLTSSQSETKEAEETVWEWDIDAELFSIPILEKIGNATVLDVSETQEGILKIFYKNATEETLEEFLYYCSTCGLYAMQEEREDNILVYQLWPVGSAYFGRALLDPEAKQMCILTDMVKGFVSDDQMKEHIAYYEQELSFPADFGKNVFPQFYASIGEPQPMGRTGSGIDYVFNGDPFWCEWYRDVSYLELRRYIDEMILCGFDVRLVAGIQEENGALSTIVLHFSNGDADVVVSYDCLDESASIYYETGTMWTLLYGEAYTKYIPKK